MGYLGVDGGEEWEGCRGEGGRYRGRSHRGKK